MSNSKDADRLIGQNVQRYRGDRTQQQVADAMRLARHPWGQATVYLTEKGDRPLRLTEAADLAQLLDIQLGDLLGDPSFAARRAAAGAVFAAQAQLDHAIRQYRATTP